VKRNYHPSGDRHWTRQPGVVRAHWGKLDPDRQIALYQEFLHNRPCKTWLARKYGVSRTTVWRYIKHLEHKRQT